MVYVMIGVVILSVYDTNNVFPRDNPLFEHLKDLNNIL